MLVLVLSPLAVPKNAMRIANKYTNSRKQIMALHLNVDFLAFNRTTARGVLPELWGIVPISDGAKQLLSLPLAAAASSLA